MFKNDYPDEKIGFSRFASLWPKSKGATQCIGAVPIG